MTECEHGDDPAICPPCQRSKELPPKRMTGILAQFDGRCAECDKPIVRHLDLIIKESEDDFWIHESHRS